MPGSAFGRISVTALIVVAGIGLQAGRQREGVRHTARDGRVVEAVDVLANAGEVREEPLLPSFLYIPGPNDFPAGTTDLPWAAGEGGRPRWSGQVRLAPVPLRAAFSPAGPWNPAQPPGHVHCTSTRTHYRRRAEDSSSHGHRCANSASVGVAARLPGRAIITAALRDCF